MKKNILILIALFASLFSFNLQAQTITASEQTPLGGLRCNSDVQASFSTTGTFNAGNIFTLEVSDENGDFTTPSVTTTRTTVPSMFSPITMTIPASYPSGNGYRLRVRSSNPVVTSAAVSTTMPIIKPPALRTVTATPIKVLYGQSSTIEIENSENGIEYELARLDAPSIYYAGTGSTLSFSTGTLTQTTNYYVMARYPLNTILCQTNYYFTFPTPTVSVTTYSTQVNGVRYETIQGAINAATTGQTIEIVADRFYDEDVVIDNNKALTFTSSVTDYKDLVLKSIQVNNGSSLTIDGNMSVAGMFAMQGDANVTVNAGKDFALLSTADQTAMIYNGSATKTIVGDVITERFVPDPTTIPGFTGTYSGAGYHMFSSPFKDAKVSDFADDMTLLIPASYNTSADPAYTTPFPNFYRYNETRTGSPSASGYYSAFTMGYEVPALTDALEVGRGYEVNLGTGIVIDIKGKLSNGLLPPIPLSNTENGYNLIGNPYPSPIDWSTVYNLGANSSNVDPTIYIDIKTGQYSAAYAIFNGLTRIKVNGGQEDIALMQGFFVKAKGTNPELVMDNSVRLTTYENTRFFKTQETEVAKEGLFKLGILSDGNMDETAIAFIEDATSTYDRLYDAEKIHKINGYASTLYSYNKNDKTSENEYYAINVLPKFDEDMVLPLAMNIVKAGKHKIVVREIKYFHSLSNVYLYDSLTETLHDLKANPEYEFVAPAGTEVKRFVILFKTNKTFTQKDHIVAYPNPTSTDFSYSLKNSREGVHIIRVFDATGKLILEREEDKQGAFLEGTINLEQQPLGLYLLQISDSKQTTNVRIIKE